MAGWGEEFRNPADGASGVLSLMCSVTADTVSRVAISYLMRNSDPTEPSKFYAFHHWSNCHAYLHHSLSKFAYFLPTNCCSQNATLTLFNSFVSSTREKSKISEQESTCKCLVIIFNKWPHWVAAWALPLSSSHIHTWNHEGFIHEITKWNVSREHSATKQRERCCERWKSFHLRAVSGWKYNS